MFEDLSFRSSKISFSSWLVCQATLKKIEVKLKLLTDVDMLFVVQKCIRGGIFNATRWYAKANNKYMKDYDKNRKLSFLNIGI